MERRWPVYHTGTADSMHALGVLSINFANFERAITWVFGAITGKPETEARRIHARDGTSKYVKKLEQAWRERRSSGVPDDRVHHFIAATETLIKNRNLLMHSMMVEDTLYKTTFDGERIMLQATTTQIRTIADDLHRYFSHGRYLAKCIVNMDQRKPYSTTVKNHHWPSNPPAPKPLLNLH